VCQDESEVVGHRWPVVVGDSDPGGPRGVAGEAPVDAGHLLDVHALILGARLPGDGALLGKPAGSASRVHPPAAVAASAKRR
jgi:hypothetical protein